LGGALTLSGDIIAQLEYQLQTNETPTRGSLAITLDTPQEKCAYQCGYRFNQGQLALTDVNLVIPGANLRGDVAIHHPSGLSEGDLLLHIDDTGPAASWFGQTVQGRGEVQARLQIADNTQQILSTWELTQAAWSDMTLDMIRGSLNGQDVFGTVRGSGTLSAQGLTRGAQQIDHLTMDLQATRHSGLLSLQMDGVATHPFRLNTQAAWQPSSTGWAVTLGATQVNYHAQQLQLEPGAELLFNKNTGTLANLNVLFDEMALSLRGTLLISPAEARIAGALQVGGDVVADVTYEGTLPLHSRQGQADIVVTRHNIPAKGSVAYAWSDEALSFSEVHVTTTGLALSGQAQYQWDTGLIQGQFRAEVPDAYPVTTFLGIPAQAQAQAQFDLRAEQGIQHVQSHWAIEDVNWATLRLVSLQGDMDLQQPWTAPTGHVTAHGAGLTWKQIQWDHWTLQAEGDRHALDLSVLGAGAIDQPLVMDARATVRLDGSQQALVLHQGLLQYGPETLVLQSPAIIWRDAPEPNASPRYTLDGWLWQAQNASLLVEGWVTRDQLAFQTVLSDLSIEELAIFDSHTLSGQIDATINMFGSPQQPHIELAAVAQTLRLQEPESEDVTPLDSLLSLCLTPDDLSANLVVTSSQGDRLQADIGLPIHFALWPPHWTQSMSDFNAHISTDMDVRMLDCLPVLHEAIVEGRVLAELTYRGTAEAGRVQGQAQWVDGYYENILPGTVIQNIQARLRAQGDTLILDEAVATDGDQGRLAIAGTLRMVPGLPYRIDVQADRFPWIQRADITAAASGEVTLAGTLHTMTLSGKLSLDEGLLDLSALPPPPPAVLISTRTDPTDADASQPESLTVQGNLQLDLNKGFRMYGAGLDSIWDGQIQLVKANEHWDVTGSVSPRRGEFRLMGRPFRLTEGSIQLDGSWPIAPILDLSAVYVHSGIEARVHITGRASNPVIRIESDPPLPEDAILATVLFGRDLATITAMQALQLAAAVKSLHSPGGGADVFRRTRQAVGVDTIEFRQADDPSDSSSVAVGKYLVPKVYVEVQQPLSRGGIASTIIEYEIRPNLTVETDAGPGIRPGISINWKKDY
ncbi:MAG: translocation/assembly module TamB, partial [Planctomycetes bacterium]|nr:translocation/assembly module TamB [Planctomycetota bacterium]